MTDVGTFSSRHRTSTVSNSSFVPDEPVIASMRRRSSSFALGCRIHYKTTYVIEPKGVWGAYQTQEEFMAMHFR